VLPAARAAALWAGGIAAQDQVPREIKGVEGKPANVNAVPRPDAQRLPLSVALIDRLLVKRRHDRCGDWGEAASAEPSLTPTHGAPDPHATIGAPSLEGRAADEVLIVEFRCDFKRRDRRNRTAAFGEKW
jgi:hypothetical protein